MKEETKRNNSSKVSVGRTSIRILLQETLLSDIMVKDIVTLDVDAPFSKVPKKIRESGFRHLPIVDKTKKLVGIITERDMYKIQSPRKLLDGKWYYDESVLNDIILRYVMNKKPFAMSGEETVGAALVKMVRYKYGCILIVNKDYKLKGIVTRYDILKRAVMIYEKELI